MFTTSCTRTFRCVVVLLALGTTACASTRDSVRSIFEASPPAFEQTLAAASRGDPEAQYRTAVAYNTGRGTTKDAARFARWARAAAEQGHPGGQYLLGWAYATGHGVPRDAVEAVRWYRRAAEQGYAKAQYRLAVAYNTGRGIPKNPERFAHWARAAAEQGHPGGQYLLGWAYVEGGGVQKDPAWGLVWYRRAAIQGHLRAQYRLGRALASGLGGPADRSEAYRWLSLAAGAGHADARTACQALRPTLTPSELAQAAEWLKRWSPVKSTAQPDAALVRYVQTRLKSLGYPAGAVDGILGPKTQAAIAAYERSNGRVVDGRITSELVRALRGKEMTASLR